MKFSAFVLILFFFFATPLRAQNEASVDVTELLQEIVETRLRSFSTEVSSGGVGSRIAPERDQQIIDRKIGELLIQNGQIDLLERFADSHPPGRLHAQLFEATVKQWAATDPNDELRETFMDSLRRIGPKVRSSGFSRKIYGLDAAIQSDDDLEAVAEIVRILPGDMKDYAFRQGMYGPQYNKMDWLSKIAARQWETGDKDKAIETFDSMDVDVTRDKARLLAIERWLRGDDPRVEFADDLSSELETDTVNFWGNFRIGWFHVVRKDRAKSLASAKRMEEFYDAVQSKSYLTKLYVGVASLELLEGKVTEETLEKIRKLPRRTDEQDALSCILALADKPDESLNNPVKVQRVILRLTDFENGDYVRNCPLHLIDSARRLDAAVKLARDIEIPLLRARLLWHVARKITSRNKSENQDSFEKRSKLTLDVVNDKQAAELAREALDSAKERKESVEIRTGSVITQDMVLRDIAYLLFHQGSLDEGSEAIELISTEIVPEKQRNSMFRKQQLSFRDQAVNSVGHSAAYRDAPFMENGGQEVFRYLEFLGQFDSNIATNAFTRIPDKFATLGKWQEAERAFRKGIEHFGEVYFPRKVARLIAADNDARRFRQWKELCRCDQSLKSLLYYVCLEFQAGCNVPSPPMLIEIEALSQQTKPSDIHSDRAINTALVMGYWADGMKGKADEKLQEIAEMERGQLQLSEVVQIANKAGFPELAVRTAEKITNAPRRKEALLRGSMIQSTVFEPEKIRDKTWLNTQPVEAQLAYKIRLVTETLKSKTNRNEK